MVLKRLQRRDLLTQEAANLLEDHGFDEEEIANALEFLEYHRALDDPRSIASLLDLATEKQLGRDKLRVELVKRGLSEEQAESAASALDDESQLATIREIVERRFIGPADAGKAGRYLLSRGFPEELVRAVLEEKWAFD